MIDMEKLEQKFKLIDSALSDLNDIEKDLTIQQYVINRNKRKEKQKASDIIGGMNIASILKRIRKGEGDEQT